MTASAPVRVACLQMRLAPSVAEAEARAAALAGEARDRGARLALLPEYWFMPAAGGPREQVEDLVGLDAALARVARAAGLAVAGNALERDDGRLWNTLLVLDAAGARLGAQRKLHPMPTEEKWGVGAWRDLEVFPWEGARVGGLVCADVLHPEAARILALRGAEVVLNPVMSWHKPADATRDARRAMFLARAYDNACFVLKAGSVGPAGPSRLVGRSLVAAPWGIVAEAGDELGEEVVVADLDLGRLREERRRSLSLGRRHPEAYGALTDRGEPRP